MDGTLLPMDIDVFTRAYFKELTFRMSSFGYDNNELFDGVWKATGAMISNDGEHTNEESFWNLFSKVCGERVLKDRARFDDFYVTYFDNAKDSCGFDPAAGDCVKAAKNTGCKVVLASNPIFPRTAQIKRACWAGVDPDLFDHITSYENSRFCKPNLGYYLDICSLIGINAEDCLMIGNDVGEDMVAEELGMQTFLVTPWMINRKDADISRFHRGDLNELHTYLKSL